MGENAPNVSLLVREIRRQAAEIARLRNLLAEERAKNAALRAEMLMATEGRQALQTGSEQGVVLPELTPDDAAAFFSLFRGRSDVYSHRVQRKEGGAAYYPVCDNFWKEGVCPRRAGEKNIKCSQCSARAWKPVSKRVLLQHFEGGTEEQPFVVGIYPMLENDMCRLLVFDFDDHEAELPHWKEEVEALREVCRLQKVPVLVERSRSGNGAHVWLFFEQAVSAAAARAFGEALLTKGAESVNQRSFISYDRMIPAQEHLEAGQLGNLIALPLQGVALRKGNSAFVDEKWQPYANQWEVVTSARRIDLDFLERKTQEWAPKGTWGILASRHEGSAPDDSTPSPLPWEIASPWLRSDVAGEVKIVRADMLWVDTQGIRPRLLNALRRLAAFGNPLYYRHRRHGFSVRGIPRIIGCHEEAPPYIGLPRGLWDELETRLNTAKIPCTVEDKRCVGKQLNVTFQGELYPTQQDAADRMLAYENGILAAATAFGKTAVGAYLVAQRRVNTLVLVHNREIMKNWVEDFGKFLLLDETPPKYRTASGRERQRKSCIGSLYAGHDSTTGLIDVAMFSSLNEDDERLKQYGMVIMDECHHAAAAGAEAVLKRVHARYVYGLTATPKRDDGQEPKLNMLFGPVRYRFTARQRAEMQQVQHSVYPRFTAMLPTESMRTIQEAYHSLTEDFDRNRLIAADVAAALVKGRTPLVLTKFRRHAETLRQLLEGKANHLLVLVGGRSTKEREELRRRLSEIPSTESVILIATGQYIGEGFNFPRLDTLMLTAPIAWEGNVEQYAGRLHRDYEGKQHVVIYDYVDIYVRVLEKMYHKRLKTYRRMGYAVWTPFGNNEQQHTEKGVFSATEYEPYMERDFLEAASHLTICSPGVNHAQVQWFSGFIGSLLARHIHPVLYTLSPENYPEAARGNAAANIQRLQQLGVTVVSCQELHEHVVIVDRKIVWYGDINVLSRKKEEGNFIRFTDADFAANLLRCLYFREHDALPSQTYLPLEEG